MAEEHPDSEEVILGEHEVQLDHGGVVHIRPWGIRTARRMMSRIKSVFQLAFGGTTNMANLLESSYDEVVSLVADSIGVEVLDLEDETKYTLSDLIALLDAIVKVNFTERPGLIKNAQSLLGTLEFLLPKEAEIDDPKLTESDSSTQTPSPPQ